jgi:hypothetical protein
MGIEPTFLAWEATFLPLEDTRVVTIVRGPPTCGNPEPRDSGSKHLLCKRQTAC